MRLQPLFLTFLFMNRMLHTALTSMKHGCMHFPWSRWLLLAACTQGTRISISLASRLLLRVSASTQGSVWSVAGPPLPLLPEHRCSPIAVSQAIPWGCVFWYHRLKQHPVQRFRWRRFSHPSEMLYKLLFNDHWLGFCKVMATISSMGFYLS